MPVIISLVPSTDARTPSLILLTSSGAALLFMAVARFERDSIMLLFAAVEPLATFVGEALGVRLEGLGRRPPPFYSATPEARSSFAAGTRRTSPSFGSYHGLVSSVLASSAVLVCQTGYNVFEVKSSRDLARVLEEILTVLSSLEQTFSNCSCQ